MLYLKKWWGKAVVSRADTHVYFTASIYYTWEGDDTVQKIKLCRRNEIAIECFNELVKRRIILEIKRVKCNDKPFFQEKTYRRLRRLVRKHAKLIFSTSQKDKPRDDLFFHVNVNLVRTDDVVFDLLFLGYKYPFENICMPIEVFHEFIDRLKPRIRINTVHGARKMKLFIAHASENKDFVRKLAIDLVARGLLVWFDEWEIKVGESIVQKINDGIESSAFMVLVMSKDSVSKPWVKEEMSAGFVRGLRAKGVYILPVLLEKCSIPPLLADKKYADFSNGYDDGLAELLKSL